MYRKFLNARSPLRLLEKGLNGGLGIGNIGVLLAGHGVGKTPFLVGVALDELLRGGCVLHVALDQTVSHVRNYYDGVYEALASSSHLDDAAVTHHEIDGRRSIRAYAPSSFSPAKLSDAVAIESEAGKRPTLILIEGMDGDQLGHDDVETIRKLAAELAAEIWISVSCPSERVEKVPEPVRALEDVLSVILALEPSTNGQDHIALRAIKDHDSPDVSALHVALDPKTLLVIRS